MSIEISSWVWKHAGIDGTGLLVLLSLADQANDDGYCWPSQRTTAHRCRISDRQVRTWIDRLVSSGLLESIPRAGTSNYYRVLTPEAHFRTPLQPTSGVGRKPTSGGSGSPLPTNHQEPSLEPPVEKYECIYCHTYQRVGKKHYCSAMRQDF